MGLKCTGKKQTSLAVIFRPDVLPNLCRNNFLSKLFHDDKSDNKTYVQMNSVKQYLETTGQSWDREYYYYFFKPADIPFCLLTPDVPVMIALLRDPIPDRPPLAHTSPVSVALRTAEEGEMGENLAAEMGHTSVETILLTTSLLCQIMVIHKLWSAYNRSKSSEMILGSNSWIIFD